MYFLTHWESFISSTSAGVPLIVALILWRRLDRPLRILGVMFLAASLTEVGCWYLAYHGISNLWLTHLWSGIEYVCMILAFACWQKSERIRNVLRWSVPVFLAVLLMNKYFFEPFSELDSLTRSISSVVIICVAAFTFQRIIIEPGASLIRDSRFWVSSAALIYHAGTLVLFTLGRGMMADNPANFNAIYTVHSVINTFTNLLFAGGFLCRKPR